MSFRTRNGKYQGKKMMEQVFSGNFPKDALKKLNRSNLEQLVLKLVECTSDGPAKDTKDFQGLCRSLFLKELDKPQWWPSDHIITNTITPDGKYFMDLLRFLVYKCCEFFKKPSEDLNSELFVTERDEVMWRPKRKLVKEASESAVADVTPVKRRTLLPRNGNIQERKVEKELNEIKSPVIKLKDVFYKPKPLDQDHFLQLFHLKSTARHSIENLPVLTSAASSSIKFNMCTHIPFSSDIGLELMKRDNHTCPEVTKSRKLDRLEWYLNKPFAKLKKMHFEITYQEKKGSTFHVYKLPKRQHYQCPEHVSYQPEAFHHRYLRVMLVNYNLKNLQNTYEKQLRSKVKVVLSRLNGDKELFNSTMTTERLNI